MEDIEQNPSESIMTVDYRDDAEAYELEERSRPDEMAMLHLANDIGCELINAMPTPRVLDLCCGTGLSHEQLSDQSKISHLVGVDISDEYLTFARNRYGETSAKPKYIRANVLEVDLPEGAWDLIMMCSAYHHIEDKNKRFFLSRVRSFLSKGGFGIFAENILPDYTDRGSSYAHAVKSFYRKVLATTKEFNPNVPAIVEGLIWKVAEYGVEGDYEYKVSYDIFREDLEACGLRVISETKVWPFEKDHDLGKGGNYVLTVQAA